MSSTDPESAPTTPQSTIWNRRSQNPSRLSLSMSSNTAANTNASNGGPPSSKIFGGGPPSARAGSSHGKGYKNPFELHALNTATTPSLPSPTTVSGTKSASAAFALGVGGAFGQFGLRTPKTPGGDGLAAAGAPTAIGKGGLTASEVVTGGKKQEHPLKATWVVWYRYPGNKFQDYEKSTHQVAQFSTVEEFWAVYTHLKRPSDLPHVSDYHLFRKGIRPIWEDKENKDGGKWNCRLKKGVANRYWEDLLLAIIGDQFGEEGEDLNGAVLSVRNNEDVLSVWTKCNEGHISNKIKQIMQRKLNMPNSTRIDWKSHAAALEAVTQKERAQMEKQQQKEQHQQL